MEQAARPHNQQPGVVVPFLVTGVAPIELSSQPFLDALASAGRAAVAPDHRERGLVPATRRRELDEFPFRERVGQDLGHLRRNAEAAPLGQVGRGAGPKFVKTKRLECQVARVHGPVAELAGGEVAPPMPIRPFTVVRARRSRAQPHVPIEILRHGLAGRRARMRPATAGLVPGQHFTNLSQRARLDDFHRSAKRVAGRTLIPHLSGQFGGRRQRTEPAGFADRASQRLLAKDRLAGAQRQRADHGMTVVRRRDHHAVESIGRFVKHPPVVPVTLRLGELLARAIQPIGVGVAQRGKPRSHARQGADKPLAAAAHTHQREVEFLVGGRGRREAAARAEKEPQGARGGGGQKLAAGAVSLHGF